MPWHLPKQQRQGLDLVRCPKVYTYHMHQTPDRAHSKRGAKLCRTDVLQAVLEGAADLFCSVACEAAYALRAGGSALRRSLFRLERGRCQACHLDCHALVTRLRCTHSAVALCLEVQPSWFAISLTQHPFTSRCPGLGCWLHDYVGLPSCSCSANGQNGMGAAVCEGPVAIL